MVKDKRKGCHMSMAKIGDQACLLINCGRQEREEAPEQWGGGRLDNTGSTVRRAVERLEDTNTFGPTS